MNVERLKQVADLIAQNPTQFNMDWWFHESDAVGNDAGGCGTAACIGGWAVFLKYKSKKGRTPTLAQVCDHCDDGSTIDEATEALKLTPTEANRLFVLSEWPVKFEVAYDNATTAGRAAKVAVARINHFIVTKGEE
jgi:hypothetical protein